MATDIRLKEALPEITESIVATYAECSRTSHLGHRPLPSREAVVNIMDDFLDLLYPGIFFEVKVPYLDGKAQVGFFTQVQGVSAQVDVMEYPEGGRNDMIHKLPSRIKQGNITLKRGLTKEAALLAWLKKSVVKAEPTNMSLTLYDSAGTKIQAWSFAQAYPVKWTASDANAGGNEIMTETLEIAHSGITSA